MRSKLAVKIIETLAEGSALVEVTLRDKLKKRCVLKTLRVREVRGRVWNRAAKQWLEVRLWTSLSVEQASPRELVRRMRVQIAACALPTRRAQSAPARQQVAAHALAFLPRIKPPRFMM